MSSSSAATPLHPWLSYRDLAGRARVLVVGAGGIGCELLKNLVLAGFHDIVVVDLDTIDVTNLNRQFLFQKQHVGKPKALVAKESALRFNPDARIEAIHDSVMSSEYGVHFFKQFKMVLNALDNRAARSHVNRMCLAADVPLVESGTAGYLGQVTVIRKKHAECYECTPKPHQKTFPGCTIRNTPSEPIHCIVWSKHLFNQLFGEIDPDEDVSPDTEDPEANPDKEPRADGNVTRISTRQWAQEQGYDGEALFNKFFYDDIKYLLSMDKLWAKRTPPTPVKWNEFPKGEETTAAELHDQEVWSVAQCAKVLTESINELKEKLKALPENDHLVWDKDDDAAMNFVTACANIRSHVFNIAKKSKFDVKSMAGNIIPAIATTNAIIAGAIVMEAIKILTGDFAATKTVYLSRKPNARQKLMVPCSLAPPNPKCYVCAEKREVSIKLNLEKMTLKAFEEKILKGRLSMVAPDVEVDGKGIILISSDEGDTEENEDKTLAHFKLGDGTILKCDDFLQDFSLQVFLFHSDKLADDAEFEFISDVSEVSAAAANGNSAAKPEKSEELMDHKDIENGDRKRKNTEEIEESRETTAKKLKTNVSAENDLICIE